VHFEQHANALRASAVVIVVLYFALTGGLLMGYLSTHGSCELSLWLSPVCVMGCDEVFTAAKSTCKCGHTMYYPASSTLYRCCCCHRGLWPRPHQPPQDGRHHSRRHVQDTHGRCRCAAWLSIHNMTYDITCPYNCKASLLANLIHWQTGSEVRCMVKLIMSRSIEVRHQAKMSNAC
jgi:hypothetical protein